MALLGISLIVASVVLFCLRRPSWFPAFLGLARNPSSPSLRPPRQAVPQDGQPNDIAPEKSRQQSGSPAANGTNASPTKQSPTGRYAAMGAPSVIVEQASSQLGSPSLDSACDEQTTPKASALGLDNPVPTLALSVPESSAIPEVFASARANGAAAVQNVQAPAPGLMPPPPPPMRSQLTAQARAAGSSTLPTIPPQPSRGLPVPNRGPMGGGLAPPPTHSSEPKKPGKEVALAPGHSPLDWARLSGHPSADLRGLPPGTGYLRVTPSMLRYYTGRKGKDAWTVLGGKVYNISPYLPFHPGGEPELLRGAAKDGTKLFGEIHPWVNFEGMLSACLIGIYVTEESTKEDDSE